MTDPADLTATEAVARMQRGELRAVELADACLARIESRDPQIRAFVHIDRSAVMRQARAIDQGLGGPLYGLPIAVKDVLDTCDMPSEYGSSIWSGHRPRADAAAVSAARKAGALIIGKTATTEFATRRAPATVNPFNSAHTPGGSSSGSAAAVAASLCPLAFGTQTAGSIIRPAAFCGVVGYKPTFGYIHRAGMKVMSEALDTIGCLARSVADCSLLVSAITGRDLTSLPLVQGPRLAVVTWPSREALPESLSRLDEVADLLAREGARVEHIELSAPLHEAFDAHPAVMNMEITRALAWELNHHQDLLSDHLKQPIAWAQSLPPETFDEGVACFVRARTAFDTLMEQFDAVLTLSAVGEAPKGHDYTGNPVFNILWTALHVPSIQLPAGIGPAGLPLGVQLVGRNGYDQDLLRIASWAETRLR